MIVNGERVGAASGTTMEVRNPATGEIVDTVPKADQADTRRAEGKANGDFAPARGGAGQQQGSHVGAGDE